MFVPNSLRDTNFRSAKADRVSASGFGQHQIEHNRSAIDGHSERGGSRLQFGRPVAGIPAPPCPADGLRVVDPVQYPCRVGTKWPSPSLSPVRATDVVGVSGPDVMVRSGTGLKAHRPLRGSAPGLESHRDEPDADEYFASVRPVAPRVRKYQCSGVPVLGTQLEVGLHVVGLCIGPLVFESSHRMICSTADYCCKCESVS